MQHLHLRLLTWSHLPFRSFSPLFWVVTYVGQAIAHIVAKLDEKDQNFNLTQPHPLPYDRWLGALKECGYDLELLPYPEWRKRYLEQKPPTLASVSPIFTGSTLAISMTSHCHLNPPPDLYSILTRAR